MKLTTMIGAGLGAMYLGNEGKGETFTSYPFPSRGKRLLGFEQVAHSEKALEKYNLNPPGRTPNADKIIEMAHDKLSKNGSIHPSLAKVILELKPEYYHPDLAGEIYEYQQFLTGQWGVDKKGRAAKGTLYLKEGMTPEQYLMSFR